MSNTNGVITVTTLVFQIKLCELEIYGCTNILCSCAFCSRVQRRLTSSSDDDDSEAQSMSDASYLRSLIPVHDPTPPPLGREATEEGHLY